MKKHSKRRMNSSPPVLFQMAAGYWVSQAIYVAAKLGIADLLDEGPKSSRELAAATGADAPSLFRLLRALAGLGVFSHTGSDYFALSGLGESLRTHAPGSLRAMVITLGEIHYQACGSLLHSVRTGSGSFKRVFGTELFDYLDHEAEAADAFNQGMTNLSAMLAYAVLCAYDFSDVSHILDVGGGHGAFLRNILKFYPHLRGTVFDMAATIEKAKSLPRAMADFERLAFIPGDFFTSVPAGADAHVLCGVLHDWDDQRAFSILANCRDAMARNGRILLVEMVVPENNENSFSKLLDLNMLVMNGGKERTRAEFRCLLDGAGYRLARVIPTLAPQSILEAIAI